mgnify:FL=1
MMKYNVEMIDDCELVGGDQGLSAKKAQALARRLAAQNPDKQVFVTFYRSSDGQHGYLNPDGNHSIDGEAY